MKRQYGPANRDGSPRKYNRDTIVTPNLILVEGPDEFHFLRFLRKRDDVQIHVYEGKDQLKLELRTLSAIEGFEGLRRVVIVRDADDDPSAAMQSVLGQWASAYGRPLPSVQSDEWFADESGRKWSVWITPDPASKGDLEELIWRAVEADAHRSCIDDLMSCLQHCQPIPFDKDTKARLYAWLSTQRDPLRELYSAFSHGARLFSPEHPAFARMATMLDSL